MSIKRYSGTGFTDISTRKRWNGTAWVNLTIGKRYNGTSWVDLWSTGGSDPTPPPAQTTQVKTYAATTWATYWGTGGRDTQTSTAPDLIQGSYDGTMAHTRRTLIFFPLTTIQANLANATSINKVELYLSRIGGDLHGEGNCYTCIKYANYSSAPATWNGADGGDADAGTPTFVRGESKWVTLNNAVGVGLKNGTVKCLVLDSDTNYTLPRYGRFAGSVTQLRITYTG